MSQTLLITGGDARFFPYLVSAIYSVRHKIEGRKIPLACFDLGCTQEQCQWLRERVDHLVRPGNDLPLPEGAEVPLHVRGLLARPFLREYFPGFDVYLWLDADAWVQDWEAVELFQRGALSRGLAIVPEVDRGSVLQYGRLPAWWEKVRRYYDGPYGPEVAGRLCSYPLLNAGVFALHREAPHWERWAEALRTGVRRRVDLFSDQTALNYVVYEGGLLPSTELLPSWCNWTCHFGLPALDEFQRVLVEPYLPHRRLGILHLSGNKRPRYRLRTTTGGTTESALLYPLGEHLSLPETVPPSGGVVRDYVAPGLARVDARGYFPHMTVGDVHQCPWAYLRRSVPHRWYVDRRSPAVGFLTCDEAHLLYNFALQFRGRRALEIGCWYGWSACHLALAGVELDVVDPLLDRPDVRESVEASLRAAGVREHVRLVAGHSPAAVEDLARREQRRWSLIFIDGDHDAPGPLRDAIAAAAFAAADAAVVFHDLAAPDVARGLEYLREQGWQTRIYQTMQIMGLAWRGSVSPVPHEPDPGIVWPLPAHLRDLSVNGRTPAEDALLRGGEPGGRADSVRAPESEARSAPPPPVAPEGGVEK